MTPPQPCLMRRSERIGNMVRIPTLEVAESGCQGKIRSGKMANRNNSPFLSEIRRVFL